MNKRIAPKKFKKTIVGPKKPAVVGKVRRTNTQAYGTRAEWNAICVKVKARDGHRCRLCGRTEHLQVDHIRQVAKGGVTVMHNLWTLCAFCHAKRPGHENAKHLILSKVKT